MTGSRAVALISKQKITALEDFMDATLIEHASSSIVLLYIYLFYKQGGG